MKPPIAKPPQYWQAIFSTGLALFAMFFGAGNMIYPLELGVKSGSALLWSALGFLVSGVGVPFIGLYAIALFKGNYWNFFSTLGRIPAWIMIMFLMIIIGPLFAVPRTEILVFNTLNPYMEQAGIAISAAHFSKIYFGILFLLAYKESNVMDIIGNILSPIKVLSFGFLIGAAFYLAPAYQALDLSAGVAFKSGIDAGYSTMDLLGAFFFGSVAYHAVKNKLNQEENSEKLAIKMLLKSSVVGAVLLCLIYLGFMLAAHRHAQTLGSEKIEALIGFIGKSVLGNKGGLIMGLCVAVACFATALALINVFSHYLFNTLFKQKLPKLLCLAITILIAYNMSLLDFSVLQHYLGEILNVCYPALIVFSVLSIVHKHVNLKAFQISVPVLGTAILAYVFQNFLA
ncbi:MAG: branched-chain amino acid transport system II carrier protein [Gammaproteobacteria bacterium]